MSGGLILAPLETVEAWLREGAGKTPGGVAFNMFATGKADDQSSWDLNECGTACCIGGALHKLCGIGTRDRSTSDAVFLERVGRGVGMTETQVHHLFWARNRPGGMFGITPIEAAGAIRSMIETGSVVWGKPVADGDPFLSGTD